MTCAFNQKCFVLHNFAFFSLQRHATLQPETALHFILTTTRPFIEDKWTIAGKTFDSTAND